MRKVTTCIVVFTSMQDLSQCCVGFVAVLLINEEYCTNISMQHLFSMHAAKVIEVPNSNEAS